MSRVVIIGAAVLAAIAIGRGTHPGEAAPPFPEAPVEHVNAQEKKATAVLAGGCFWGIEGVYEHVKGVLDVVSGYSGGKVERPDYGGVSSGTTGHAESVRITYDPTQVSYGDLLRIFFAVAHDPTQLNRQGPDVGTQYRSAIFFSDAEQEKIAREYIAKLTDTKTYPRPIVTEVTPLKAFYLAEDYHQDYMEHHPNQPYIVFNDRPKVEHLKERFPQFYR